MINGKRSVSMAVLKQRKKSVQPSTNKGPSKIKRNNNLTGISVIRNRQMSNKRI
jgi:hypothetical protein